MLNAGCQCGDCEEEDKAPNLEKINRLTNELLLLQ